MDSSARIDLSRFIRGYIRFQPASWVARFYGATESNEYPSPEADGIHDPGTARANAGNTDEVCGNFWLRWSALGHLHWRDSCRGGIARDVQSGRWRENQLQDLSRDRRAFMGTKYYWGNTGNPDHIP